MRVSSRTAAKSAFYEIKAPTTVPQIDSNSRLFLDHATFRICDLCSPSLSHPPLLSPLDTSTGGSNNYTTEILIGVATTLASALVVAAVKKLRCRRSSEDSFRQSNDNRS